MEKATHGGHDQRARVRRQYDSQNFYATLGARANMTSREHWQEANCKGLDIRSMYATNYGARRRQIKENSSIYIGNRNTIDRERSTLMTLQFRTVGHDRVRITKNLYCIHMVLTSRSRKSRKACCLYFRMVSRRTQFGAASPEPSGFLM